MRIFLLVLVPFLFLGSVAAENKPKVTLDEFFNAVGFSSIELSPDGNSVVIRDRLLATQDLYPLSQTPLRFLLADRIDLLQDTNVVGVTADDTFVSVLIEEKQAFIGTNRLLMMFDSKDFKLKQWTVTDVQGYDTTIAVSNLDTSKRPDPNLFRFDYTRLVQ